MREVIRLDDIRAIPPELRLKLAQQENLFLRHKYTDSLVREHPIATIANELDDYVKANLFIGYHCTKEAEKGDIKKRGLRVTDLEQHQQDFLETHKKKFTEDEIQLMKAIYARFNWQQRDYREGKIWFCLSPQLVLDSGTKYFFKYYGGEAIYFWLMRHEVIADKLSKIGRPVVVEARLDPNTFKINRVKEFSLEMLSYYHKAINPKAHMCLGEGYSLVNIKPEEIIQVHEKDVFFKTHKACF